MADNVLCRPIRAGYSLIENYPTKLRSPVKNQNIRKSDEEKVHRIHCRLTMEY
jgi:hypothetical protein